MAGAFGALKDKYDLSVKVGADLVAKIEKQPAGAEVVAIGHLRLSGARIRSCQRDEVQSVGAFHVQRRNGDVGSLCARAHGNDGFFVAPRVVVD